MAATRADYRLFYDASCGPCSFFAYAFRGISRRRFPVLPLEGSDADHALAGMAPEYRFNAFHFLVGPQAYTGADAMPPLMEATFGPTAGRIARNVGPVGGALRRGYLYFWNRRRIRGCAASPPG